MQQTHPPRSPRYARRGGVYVLVLMTTTVVAAMGLLGLSVAKVKRTEGERIADAVEARQLAASAIDAGLHIISTEPDWRINRTPGDWIADEPIGSGLFTLHAGPAGGGGSFSTNADEAIEVTGYGYRGSSRVVLRANVVLDRQTAPTHVRLLYAGKPLGYWPLSGESGAGYEYDVVAGNDADGDWSGDDIVPGIVPGLGDQTAPWFSGNGGTIEIGQTPAYDDIRTVSVWFWAEPQAGQNGIVSRDASGRGTGGRWQITYFNGTLQGAYDTQLRTILVSAPNVPTKQWNHAVFAVDDDGMRLYLNGVLVDEWYSIFFAGELDGDVPTEEIYLGVSRLSSSSGAKAWTGQFKGAISELALLAVPLSTAEVAALYAAYPPPARYTIVTDSWERVVE